MGLATAPPSHSRRRGAVEACGVYQEGLARRRLQVLTGAHERHDLRPALPARGAQRRLRAVLHRPRSEEHTSELQSRFDLVCRLLLEKKKTATKQDIETRKAVSHQ